MLVPAVGMQSVENRDLPGGFGTGDAPRFAADGPPATSLRPPPNPLIVPVVNRLDVVAVGVEHEGAVVAVRVFGPEPGRTVVGAAGG